MRRFLCALAALSIILAVGGAVLADLCPKCADKMFTADVGTCVQCGRNTSSSALKLCKVCSRELSECEACRAKLGPASRPASQPASRPVR